MCDLTDNYGCVYAWITLGQVGLRSTYRRCRFGQKKNHLFRWSSFWSWRLCKQAKLSHLGHRKPACIHWKANAPKTSHCSVRILFQRSNGAIFLRKWEKRGRYTQWRSLSGHDEQIFVHKNWRGGYWQHLVSTGRCYIAHSRSYTRCFAPCFRRTYYQPQSWEWFGQLIAAICLRR